MWKGVGKPTKRMLRTSFSRMRRCSSFEIIPPLGCRLRTGALIFESQGVTSAASAISAIRTIMSAPATATAASYQSTKACGMSGGKRVLRLVWVNHSRTPMLRIASGHEAWPQA